MATLVTELRSEKSIGADGLPQLEITQVIRAGRAKVWEAWTDPEIMKSWYAPGAMCFVGATVDLREGGAYEVEMRGVVCATEEQAKEERQVTLRGEYRRIVPRELLQFTWCGSWAPTEISLVTVSLRDVEGGTAVTLRHEQFAVESTRDRHAYGWERMFGKLAGLVEG